MIHLIRLLVLASLLLVVAAPVKAEPPVSLLDKSKARPLTPEEQRAFGPKSNGVRYDPRMIRAMEIARERAKPKMTWYCWKYVKDALLAAGLVNSRPTSPWAKEAGNELCEKYGFVKLKIKDPRKAPVGAVVVYGGAGCRPRGTADAQRLRERFRLGDPVPAAARGRVREAEPELGVCRTYQRPRRAARLKGMAAHFVNIDRNTPMLLPVDLRDWIPGDDMAHFILEAVELVDLAQFRTNERGCGSQQFPPRMMLALLIYCYSQGIFGSRRIEAATHQHLSVRYLAGNTHPDHDTICKFRRENFEAIAGCFLRVLELAKEIGLLRVGTVAIDGTRLQANASKHRNVGYARAGELIEQLKLDIGELMQKAEAADTTPLQKEALPQELARRQALLEKLTAARQAIEQRAQERAQKQLPAYEQKVQAQARGGTAGAWRKPPTARPEPDEQVNLTDAESRLMRKSRNEAYQQSYNAQAAVCADGSQLIVGVRVTDNASDKGQLEATLAAIPAEIGAPTAALADNGFLNIDAISRVRRAAWKSTAPAPRKRRWRQRRYDFRPPRAAERKSAADYRSPADRDAGKAGRAAGRALYRRRKTSVEPVFGIIKHVLGFRQFLLRGEARSAGNGNWWRWLTIANDCAGCGRPPAHAGRRLRRQNPR